MLIAYSLSVLFCRRLSLSLDDVLRKSSVCILCFNFVLSGIVKILVFQHLKFELVFC